VSVRGCARSLSLFGFTVVVFCDLLHDRPLFANPKTRVRHRINFARVYPTVQVVEERLEFAIQRNIGEHGRHND
jgi:hypothetical protein